MNAELVAEFLGGVPLLQRLPSSSLRKIAQVIQVEHYDEGEYVIRNGNSKGVYFIFEGEAEVCGNSEEDIRPEFILKRYDYFGDGAPTSEQQADVIASSKLTCLVLPLEHCYLLQPKSIWNADERQETCAPVETILHLDSIEVNLFQGITLPSAPKFGKVFGGQFIGHALAAASKTVDCLKIIHHLQAYFLLVGDYDIPILYEVHRLRDGKSFATRRVDAKQNGNIVFTLLASFQKEEKGFEHQEAVMPSVPAPDTLLSLEDLRERRIIDPRLPRTYRNKVAAAKYDTWPIDIRFVDPSSSTNQTKSPARLKYWLRAKGKLTDDQALHRLADPKSLGRNNTLSALLFFLYELPNLCVVAYASDLMFIGVSANPHRQRDLKINVLSLNHTMWFHRPLKADDWLLFVIESPSSSATRGLVTGQMFNQKGELVVTLVQEGLLRVVKPPPSAIRAKI